MTGAEAVMKSLQEEGIKVVFGYPGGTIMPVYDALYDYRDEIKHYLVRHEQGAIHAAQGYARATGKVGVVFATSGPGATNLTTGLADALIDSTPVVCITGQVASHLLGTDAFQETDVINIALPVTKWTVQVTQAKDIPGALAKAFYIAQSGRPGPVLVDITKDAQFQKLDYQYTPCTKIKTYHPKPILDFKAVEEAVKLINGAKKPYILVGQGVNLANAKGELLQFAEKTGIPMAVTLLGLDAVSHQHPLYVGYLGMHGNYAPNIKTNEADVILAVGMRFDDRVTGDVNTYAKQAKIIHIDIDKSEINKIIKADVALVADAKEALEALAERVSANSHQEWVKSFDALKQKEYDIVVSKSCLPNANDIITMGQAVYELSEQTQGNAIVATDVGQHQMMVSRYFNFQNPRTNITSGGLGTMGFGLPAAMGAKLGNPDEQVIVVAGDGGFQMNIQEMGTIMQYRIPVKMVILNNNFLGMVRQWQQLFFEKRYSFTEIENPDFVMVAQAYKIPGRKVASQKDLKEAIAEMLAAKTAYLLEIVVEQEENVFPMIPTGASVSDILLEAK